MLLSHTCVSLFSPIIRVFLVYQYFHSGSRDQSRIFLTIFFYPPSPRSRAFVWIPEHELPALDNIVMREINFCKSVASGHYPRAIHSQRISLTDFINEKFSAFFFPPPIFICYMYLYYSHVILYKNF